MARLAVPRVRLLPDAAKADGWVRVIDPGGAGSSRVPAGRLAYYLAKGFRRLHDPERASAPKAPRRGERTCE